MKDVCEDYLIKFALNAINRKKYLMKRICAGWTNFVALSFVALLFEWKTLSCCCLFNLRRKKKLPVYGKYSVCFFSEIRFHSVNVQNFIFHHLLLHAKCHKLNPYICHMTKRVLWIDMKLGTEYISFWSGCWSHNNGQMKIWYGLYVCVINSVSEIPFVLWQDELKNAFNFFFPQKLDEYGFLCPSNNLTA